MKNLDRIIFYGIGIALLLAFSFYDLTIVEHLYNPSNTYGESLTLIGELPFLWLVSFASWVAFRSLRIKHTKKDVGLSLVYVAAGCASSAYAALKLIKDSREFGHLLHESTKGLILMTGGVFIIMLLSSLAAAFIINIKDKEKAISWGSTVILLWISYIVLLLVFKFLWYRPRYSYVVENDVIGFIPWYKPGCTGHFSDNFASFPSGHTMNATGIIVLASGCSLFSMEENHNRRFYLITGIWVLMVGFGRIITGQHYPTDVTAGYLLGVAAYDLLISFVYPKILNKSRQVKTIPSTDY